MTREEIEEEFKKQIENGNQSALQELKSHPNLCKFYKDNFDKFSDLIKSQGPKQAIVEMKKKGMPIKEEISYFDVFIQQINSAIQKGHIKKSDL